MEILQMMTTMMFVDIMLAWILVVEKKISQLIYYPVNDGNFVIPNMEYELFYYDYGWISLGKKIANDFFWCMIMYRRMLYYC